MDLDPATCNGVVSILTDNFVCLEKPERIQRNAKLSESPGFFIRQFTPRGSLAEVPFPGSWRSFNGLADEELRPILQYLDLIARLKFSRVCKRWKCLLSELEAVQYLKIDRHSKDTRILHHELNTDPIDEKDGPGRPLAEQSYKCDNVRTLILDLTFGVNSFGWLEHLIPRLLAERLLPGLIQIQIANFVTCRPYLFPCLLKLGDLNPSVQVTFLNGLISAVPCASFPAGILGVDGGADRQVYLEYPLCDINRWYVAIPELKLTSNDLHGYSGGDGPYQAALCAVLWPYGDGALKWLAQNAHWLNYLTTSFHDSEIRVFSLPSMLSNIAIREDSGCVFGELACPEHGLFCDHLDLDHYRQISGHFRRLLSLCILEVCNRDLLLLAEYDFLDNVYALEEEDIPVPLARTRIAHQNVDDLFS